MVEEHYVDLEILAKLSDVEDYLVRISKEDLATLVGFDNELVLRHWDGTKPLVLETYGEEFVRTREDASEGNNLARLPQLRLEDLNRVLG